MSASDVRGRRAVVTGASRGFGAAVAATFARAGARLMLSARNAGELEAARTAILADVPEAEIALCVGDIAIESDVRRLARETKAALGGADVLVCNAGIYGPKGPIETTEFAPWAATIATNLFGVVLCAQAFAADLKASERGKVVILSGGGATKPMPYLSAYAASKAAVVRFGETLAEEWKAHGIDVNMLAPGALNTRMLDEILEAGPEAVGQAYYASSIKQKKNGGSPPERAAELCTYFGSRESDGITGKLISAVWDPWERLGEFREKLAATDIYTLRRIIPEDRGQAW
jgi:NAD(P)-dependent dehydrogenase (short-subunit alcohol dehydrogenase family)